MTPQKEREFLRELEVESNGGELLKLYWHVKIYHSGKEHAVKIDHLFDTLVACGADAGLGISSPGELRKLCAKYMPFCSFSQGIYYPVTSSEMKEFHQWLKSRSISLFERIRKIEDLHRDLLESKQMELF